MTMRREVYVYDDELSGFLPVLARREALATRYAVLDEAFATGQTGAIRKLVKYFAPGFFAGSIPGSAKARILPRMTTTAATAASGTTITFRAGTAGIFIPTDVLSVIAPSARITISGTWANNNTATATIGGQQVTSATISTAEITTGGGAAAQGTNQIVANKLIAAINASPVLYKQVSALSVVSGATDVVIVIWAKDFSSTYTLTSTATGGTAVASGSVLAPNVTIGTIAANGVNATTDVVTISAASVSVPSGMPIGVATSLPDNLGLISPEMPIDLLYRESAVFGLYVDTDVYSGRMPYTDGQLTALYPQINYV